MKSNNLLVVAVAIALLGGVACAWPCRGQEPVELPQDRENIYELDMEALDPGTITVTDPTGQKRRYWYLAFVIGNFTGQTRAVKVNAEIVTDTAFKCVNALDPFGEAAIKADKELLKRMGRLRERFVKAKEEALRRQSELLEEEIARIQDQVVREQNPFVISWLEKRQEAAQNRIELNNTLLGGISGNLEEEPELLDAWSMAGEIASGKVKDGFLLFPEVAPDVDDIRFRIGGLTNASKVEGEGADRRKYLSVYEIFYRRPGDRIAPGLDRQFLERTGFVWTEITSPAASAAGKAVEILEERSETEEDAPAE